MPTGYPRDLYPELYDKKSGNAIVSSKAKTMEESAPKRGPYNTNKGEWTIAFSHGRTQIAVKVPSYTFKQIMNIITGDK